jgi:hypothetical protein
MDAEINNVIYMELNSIPKIANSTCGKTIDVETIDRDSTVVHKGKTVLLQAWSGPEDSRKLRFLDFMTTVQDGGKVSLTQRPPLPPGNAPGTHFC